METLSAKLTVILVKLVLLCALEGEAGLNLNFMKCIIILKTLPFSFDFY